MRLAACGYVLFNAMRECCRGSAAVMSKMATLLSITACVLMASVVVALAAPSTKPSSPYAFVTLVCNDEFVMGAEALAQSLWETKTTADLVALVPPGVTKPYSERLVTAGWKVVEVPLLPNPYTRDLAHIQCVFTKFMAWKLVQYEKVVHMDVDTLALQNIDDLFLRPGFTAGPDMFPPDSFNCGVMVIQPSEATFNDLTTFQTMSADMTDQGFLNNYVKERFGGWYQMSQEHRLPFAYNTLTKLKMYNLWAWENAKKIIKVIHFSGWSAKPWQEGGRQGEPSAGGDEWMMDVWWSMYHRGQERIRNTGGSNKKRGVVNGGRTIGLGEL